MVYKKNRRYRKKRFNKKKNYQKITNKQSGQPVKYTINRQIGIPDRMFTTLCVTNQEGAYVDGSFVHRIYSLNSLYDPYGSYGTVQPQWFDQYSALYKFYKVTGCFVNIQLQNTYSADPVRLVMYADTDPSSPNNIEEARMRKGARYTILGATTSGSSIKGLTKYYNFRSILGCDLTDQIYETAVGSDPTYQIYLHFVTLNADMDSSAISYRVHSYIKFYCSFFDRKPVANS